MALLWLGVAVVLFVLSLSALARLARRWFPDPEQRYWQLVQAARHSQQPTEAEADALWCAERERELTREP
jgi:hypothetical protein